MSGEMLVAILGAGQGTRFGSDKLAADLGGVPVGMRTLSAAQSTGHPVVWIGSGIPESWTPPGCEVIVNRDAHRGMGTSVACAARVAKSRGAAALMILLADMPLVGPDLLARLLQEGPPACCVYPSGNIGPPALFAQASFDRLERLHGVSGAAAVLRTLDGLALIPASGDEVRDIDRPEDLFEAASIALRPTLDGES